MISKIQSNVSTTDIADGSSVMYPNEIIRMLATTKGMFTGYFPRMTKAGIKETILMSIRMCTTFPTKCEILFRNHPTQRYAINKPASPIPQLSTDEFTSSDLPPNAIRSVGKKSANTKSICMRFSRSLYDSMSIKDSLVKTGSKTAIICRASFFMKKLYAQSKI